MTNIVTDYTMPSITQIKEIFCVKVEQYIFEVTINYEEQKQVISDITLVTKNDRVLDITFCDLFNNAALLQAFLTTRSVIMRRLGFEKNPELNQQAKDIIPEEREKYTKRVKPEIDSTVKHQTDKPKRKRRSGYYSLICQNSNCTKTFEATGPRKRYCPECEKKLILNNS